MIDVLRGYHGLEYSNQWFLDACVSSFDEIIQMIQDTRGGITLRAAGMLIMLSRNRIWADGQKRTAYVTTKTFLELNGGAIKESDPSKVSQFMRNLTFKYSRGQVEKWIRNGEMPV
jgi:prophage maintenance system killer protein